MSIDLFDIAGQPLARRALEIAAAGQHNLLFIGPPGAGKTMLARALPGILPLLTADEVREMAGIYEATGLPEPDGERPFRAPHHTVSCAGLIGGGKPLRPGEASLAHNGVLFLDDLPEFRRNVLAALLEPLDSGDIRRSPGVFPARFLLVAAANPCPCGYLDDPHRPCRCSGEAIKRHKTRLLSPVADRIDLRVHVSAISAAEKSAARKPDVECSSDVRARVTAARERQRVRHARIGARKDINSLGVEIQPHVKRLKEDIMFSARSYYRVVRVARTIADLDGDDAVGPRHVEEALGCAAV